MSSGAVISVVTAFALLRRDEALLYTNPFVAIPLGAREYEMFRSRLCWGCVERRVLGTRELHVFLWRMSIEVRNRPVHFRRHLPRVCAKRAVKSGVTVQPLCGGVDSITGECGLQYVQQTVTLVTFTSENRTAKRPQALARSTPRSAAKADGIKRCRG